MRENAPLASMRAFRDRHIKRTSRPAAEPLEDRRLLTAISSGERIVSSIAVSAEVDTYTFSANAHDSIAVAVGDTGVSNFFPKVQLIAPDGTTVLGTNQGQTGAGLDVQNVVQAGTYTISISDAANTTGGYAVSMFRTPGAQLVDADSGAIISGQRVTGTIDVGDLDVWTFSANAHESAALAIGDIGNTNFFPSIQVFGPDGQLLQSNSGQIGAGLDFANLPLTGTYDVLVRHAGDNFTGSYAMSLFHSPGPQVADADSGSISSGQRRTGTIDLGDIDIYTFTANAADSISLAIGDVGGTNFFPEIQLFGPDGALVASNSAQIGCGLDVHNAAAGTYYAVVRMAGDAFNGDYALTMLRTPTAQVVDADSGVITSGQRVSGTIDLGDLDVWTFTANAQDSLALAIGDIGNTNFFPQLQVYGPDGALLGDVSGQAGTGLDLQNLSLTGTYYAVVREATDNFNGSYALSLFRTPTAQAVDTDSGPITSGQRVNGTIDLGDIDIWTFTAAARDSVSLAVGDTGVSNFFPQLELFGPDGTLLGNTSGQAGTGLDVQNLVQAGTYYVVVRELTDNFNGTYALSLFRTSAGQATDVDSGPLTSSQRRQGTIDLGDLDIYTFSANAGDAFSVSVGDIDNSSFFPQMQVYRPDGVLISDTSGQIATNFDANNLPLGGTYFVVVRQPADNFSGHYVIRMAKFPAAQQTDPLDGNDGGPIAPSQTRTGATTVADLDVYTFTLSSGGNATVQLSRLFGTTFNPRLDVYGPTGALLGSQVGTTSASVTLTNVLLSGTYYAVARESGADGVGNYAISLDSAPGADTRAPTVIESRFDYDTPRQQVVFRMNESVSGTLQASDITLQNLTTSSTVPTANISAVLNTLTNEVVFQFPGYASGVLPDGNYRATLPAGSVADTAGNLLGGDVTIDFFVLAGDTNRDRTVDVTDLGVLATSWQRPLKKFSEGDFNYDGFVDVTDLGTLATNWQKTLPAPAAPAFSFAAPGFRNHSRGLLVSDVLS